MRTYSLGQMDTIPSTKQKNFNGSKDDLKFKKVLCYFSWQYLDNYSYPSRTIRDIEMVLGSIKSTTTLMIFFSQCTIKMLQKITKNFKMDSCFLLKESFVQLKNNYRFKFTKVENYMEYKKFLLRTIFIYFNNSWNILLWKVNRGSFWLNWHQNLYFYFK